MEFKSANSIKPPFNLAATFFSFSKFKIHTSLLLLISYHLSHHLSNWMATDNGDLLLNGREKNDFVWVDCHCFYTNLLTTLRCDGIVFLIHAKTAAHLLFSLSFSLSLSISESHDELKYSKVAYCTNYYSTFLFKTYLAALQNCGPLKFLNTIVYYSLWPEAAILQQLSRLRLLSHRL